MEYVLRGATVTDTSHTTICFDPTHHHTKHKITVDISIKKHTGFIAYQFHV